MDEKIVIRVVGLCGSLRKGSFTRMAVNVALAGAREAGAQAELIDLREYQLIFCDGKEDESGYPADVARLRGLVKAADGVILGTPEYHGSFSGVLKNALDLMGFDELEGKMIGLVGISGGRMGAFEAINSLRSIGRALHAWVVPEQASIAEAWRAFDAAGAMGDSKLEDRVKEVGRQVTRYALLHKCEKAREFLQQWQAAQANPGA